MKILLLIRHGSACDWHRIFNPFMYLPLEDGEKVQYIYDNQEVRETTFKHADLVIFNRHPTFKLDHLLYLRDKYKFKMWADIDDHWDLYKEHYLYDNWVKGKVKESIIKSMHNADVVTVTNKRLLRAVLPINDKAAVIPNAVPIGYHQFLSQKQESTIVRFMYAGGPSHAKDLEILRKPLEDISKSDYYFHHAEFVLAGYNDKVQVPALHEMRKIIDLAPKCSYLSGLPLESYMNHYNSADISLAPLEDNEFNSMKSNLKIIEAGCMRTPIICSNVYPFLEDNEMRGRGIFFCKDQAQWLEMFNFFIHHPTTISSYGNQLYEYVKKHYDLLEVNKLRRAIINQLKKEKK